MRIKFWIASKRALTRVECLVVILNARELDVNEVDLQLLLGLDANQERRTATSGDDFVGEVNRFEDESERALLPRTSDLGDAWYIKLRTSSLRTVLMSDVKVMR